MKSLNNLKNQFGQVLSREELKNVVGGEGIVELPDNGGGNKYAKACEGKQDTERCTVDGKQGECKHGLTGPLVCFV